ncbi:MAG: two-component system, NarL family, sensor kinase [Solirubrobacteraceae bacterium]|nr:two-component system, NarL family, sensor kinase [Solirubrobacteraceae bacterium]
MKVRPPPDTARPQPVSADRGIALLRLGLVPVAVVAVAAESHGSHTAGFAWVLAALCVYGAAMAAWSWSAAHPLRWPFWRATIDLSFIAALVYTSGGARSPLRFAFFVLPIGAALRLAPLVTAAWSAAAIAAYLLVAIPHPETRLPEDLGLLAGESLSLAWVGAAAVMLSAMLGRRERNLADLAAARGRLVQQSLDAEARERRRLAQALHDDAVQNVLLARQEIADVVRGVPGAADRAVGALDDTTRQLRAEVFAMHPVGLERAGLAAVVRGLADEAGSHGGFEADVHIDPNIARRHDDLVMSTTRELLLNVAKHAHARHVEVTVVDTGSGVQLTLADDGVGFPAGRLEEALADGHIGLASVVERIRGVGGHVEIRSAEQRGTTVTVSVPAARPASG